MAAVCQGPGVAGCTGGLWDLGTGGRKIKDVIQQVAGEGGSPEPLGHNAGLKVGEDLFRPLGGWTQGARG